VRWEQIRVCGKNNRISLPEHCLISQDRKTGPENLKISSVHGKIRTLHAEYHLRKKRGEKNPP